MCGLKVQLGPSPPGDSSCAQMRALARGSRWPAQTHPPPAAEWSTFSSTRSRSSGNRERFDFPTRRSSKIPTNPYVLSFVRILADSEVQVRTASPRRRPEPRELKRQTYALARDPIRNCTNRCPQPRSKGRTLPAASGVWTYGVPYC
jgi:hypothetical protein